MNLSGLPTFLSVAVLLSVLGTSLYAAPIHAPRDDPFRPPPTAQTPPGLIESDDDSAPTPADSPDMDYNPPAPVQPYLPAHYTMDDLGNSIRSLGPDPTDSSHYSVDDIGGL
jgi:hypothetical protein